MNEFETAAGLPDTPGYRYAEVVGRELFVAGQVPQDESGSIVAVGDPAAQAEACLNNLATIAGVHGFGIDDVRRLVVYVVGDHSNLALAWSAVVEWFGGSVPPATLLGVAGLGYQEQLVEVDARVLRDPPGPEPVAVTEGT